MRNIFAENNLTMENINLQSETFSDKVIRKLEEDGRSQKWLFNKIGMNEFTFYKRIKQNDWKKFEEIAIKYILNID